MTSFPPDVVEGFVVVVPPPASALLDPSALNLDGDIVRDKCIDREKVCVCMRRKYAIMHHPEAEIERRRRRRDGVMKKKKEEIK